jgi:hypothetical protein
VGDRHPRFEDAGPRLEAVGLWCEYHWQTRTMVGYDLYNVHRKAADTVWTERALHSLLLH